MMFNKIITLSLNPAADITCFVDEFGPGIEALVTSELYDAAGKAVDVSRVLQSYGIDNLAVIVAGEENSGRYFERLKNEHVSTRVIYTKGRIRENTSVVTPDRKVTRLVRQGPTLRHKDIEELENALSQEVKPSTLVVVAGLMPEGVTSETLQELCLFIKEAGGIIAMDTRTATLEDIKVIKPWVVKPNYEELCTLVGKRLHSLQEIKEAAQQVAAVGATHVLASLGAEGMVYTNGTVTYKADVPELEEIKSTLGAGDAALAGFIIAHDYKYDLKKSLQLAAAFGTASCLVEGTNPPRRISVAMVNNQVNISEI